MNFDETLAFVAQDVATGLTPGRTLRYAEESYSPTMGPLSTGGGTPMVINFSNHADAAFECVCPSWMGCTCDPRDRQTFTQT